MKTAMILAAGKGERLRPLTYQLPKALCQVQGVAVIERHLINLANANFTKVIINHAHLGWKIQSHLGNGGRWGLKIIYAPEPPGGLETGGGIFNALPFFNNQPFVTINADIYTDYDLNSLTMPATSLAHLILIPKPHHKPLGDFGLEPQGLLNNDPVYTFSGIACYHPDAFSRLHVGRYSVAPLLRTLAHQQKATGELFAGLWHDIGTIECLQQANQSTKVF